MQGYLAHKKHSMTLGIVLLKGPRRGAFLMSQVPLYCGVRVLQRGGGCSHASRSSPLCIQGYLAHNRPPTPWDPPRTLGIDLRQGPKEVIFFVSEATLYMVAMFRSIRNKRTF